MNFSVTIGNMATSLMPGVITRAYADRVLQRTADPDPDTHEVRTSRAGGSNSMARVSDSWPALWRQSLPGLAHIADAVSASAPVRVLAKGAEWMHTTVFYDGLREIVETSSPWESRSAAEAIRSLGRDYIEDAVRRLLRMDEGSDISFRRIAQLGDPAILVLRRIIEAEPNLRVAAINSLYHMSGSPAAGEALGDLMVNYHADVRFAVACVIVRQMTKDGQGSLSSVPAFSGIIPTAFKVYGEFVLATQAQSNGSVRANLLRPYESVYLLINVGHVQREAVIPVLTALLTAPDTSAYLRSEAVLFLFGSGSSAIQGWVESPSQWAREQENPLIRLTYLAYLCERNREQGHSERFERFFGGTDFYVMGSDGAMRLRSGRDWMRHVREFQIAERNGRNDPLVIAAAQTVLDGEEFTYKMAFQAETTGVAT